MYDERKEESKGIIKETGTVHSVHVLYYTADREFSDVKYYTSTWDRPLLKIFLHKNFNPRKFLPPNISQSCVFKLICCIDWLCRREA